MVITILDGPIDIEFHSLMTLINRGFHFTLFSNMSIRLPAFVTLMPHASFQEQETYLFEIKS